jgi:hypothetical protein
VTEALDPGVQTEDDQVWTEPLAGVKQRRLDPLHPLGMPQPRTRAPLAHVLARDPGLGQPPVGEQLTRPTRVLAIGLGAPLATPATRAS